MRIFHNKSCPVLKIVVNLEQDQSRIAADTEFIPLKHPNIKRKYKQSDEWLEYINNMVRSIIGSMHGRKFKIIKAYPSNKSYTYYIRFQPTDKQGNVWNQELELQIELRDHSSNTHESFGETTSRLFVHSYNLNGKTYKQLMQLMNEIWRILDDLQDGDFSTFMTE